MITLNDIREAQGRIRGVTERTHLIEFNFPGKVFGDARQLFLKPENQQPIGAFKLRGAYNKIASLSEKERERGVISYSSGNHAQGVAYAARALGVKAVIVMPDNAPPIKRAATVRGASVKRPARPPSGVSLLIRMTSSGSLASTSRSLR